MYATTKELKKKEFTEKSQNVKQAIGIQVTSSRKISIKKIILVLKPDRFFSKLCINFEPLLGWKCAFICHEVRTGKESI